MKIKKVISLKGKWIWDGRMEIVKKYSSLKMYPEFIFITKYEKVKSYKM